MVPLTTVAIDAEEAAERILAELVSMIEGGEPPARTRSTSGRTLLIIRRSSSPAPPPATRTTCSRAVTEPPLDNPTPVSIPTRKDSDVFTTHPTQVPPLHRRRGLQRLAALRLRRRQRRQRRLLPAAAAASQVPQADIDKAMDTETTLTFWTWVPDITNEVKLFTTKYPKIKVNVVNVGQGAPHYQKLRTAIQSGQGAPDVAQVEFQFINSFTLGDGSLLDLTPYAPADAQGQATPTGSGRRSQQRRALGSPAGHRPDGPALPRRPAQRRGHRAAEDLRRLRRRGRDATAPRTRRATWSTSRRTSPARSWPTCGRRASARSRFDGKQTVTIDLASDEAKKVVKFWGDLVTSGGASNDADFNDSWYQGLNSGK